MMTNPACCYVCGCFAGEYRRYLNDTYQIVKCGMCGLEYTDPPPTKDALAQFYADYSDVRAAWLIVEKNSQDHLKLLKEYGWHQESNTLDFGAGPGGFVQVAGEHCFGVEVYPQKVSHSRVTDTIDELRLRWDFITLWGVLEHLPDPVEVILDLASRLQMGGVLALTTVDAEGIIPYYYKPPEHVTYWTRKAFEVLAKKTGLEIVEYQQPYFYYQLGSVYTERLLSRTPTEYRQQLSARLPKIVYVPTNEVRCVLKKVTQKEKIKIPITESTYERSHL